MERVFIPRMQYEVNTNSKNTTGKNDHPDGYFFNLLICFFPNRMSRSKVVQQTISTSPLQSEMLFLTNQPTFYTQPVISSMNAKTGL